MKSYIYNHTCLKLNKCALMNKLYKNFKRTIEYFDIDKVVLNIRYIEDLYIVYIDFYSHSIYIGQGYMPFDGETFIYLFMEIGNIYEKKFEQISE